MEENPHFSSPSSSCVDPSPCKYDVFISFRGEDTRRSFTGHLYSALCRNQIDAYIDEVSLEKGDDVSRALPKAIEESAISIIIFSKDYASSTWCLNELVHILKCKKKIDQTVLPIFLGVNPSDIRKQTGSYGDAFVKHEQRFNNTMDKAQEWRQALIEAAGLSGWDSQVKSEHVIVDEVVGFVKEKLKHIRSNGGIEDLLKRLQVKLQSANMVLNDAEEKQLTNQVVKELIGDLKEVIFRADELNDKIKYEKSLLTKTPVQSLLTKTRAESLLTKTRAQSLLTKTPAQSLLPKTPAQSLLTKTPVQSLLTKTPAVSLLPKTLVESLLTKTPVQSLLTKTCVESLLTMTPTESFLTMTPAESFLTWPETPFSLLLLIELFLSKNFLIVISNKQ